jgi:hypothetical protein
MSPVSPGDVGIGWWLFMGKKLGSSRLKLCSKIARAILDGYFNPLVFWYQWEYLLTSKDFFLLQGT